MDTLDITRMIQLHTKWFRIQSMESYPEIYTNKKYVANVNFGSFPRDQIKENEISSLNTTQVASFSVSRKQILNQLESKDDEEQDSLTESYEEKAKTNFVSGQNENTYVSISDSMYQSLSMNNKSKKLPCPILVCNLLASHADTFR